MSDRLVAAGRGALLEQIMNELRRQNPQWSEESLRRVAMGKTVKQEYLAAQLGAGRKTSETLNVVGIGLPEPQSAPVTGGLVSAMSVAAPPQSIVTTELQNSIDRKLEALNSKHAIIDNYGGKTVILSADPSSLDPMKTVSVYQTKADFLLRYSNRFVEITEYNSAKGCWETSAKPLGQWWLGHPQRAQFHGVTFLPGGARTINGCLNTWKGWGVDPIKGDWELIYQHIREVLANGHDVVADYIVAWIAWAIQNPHRQADVALTLIGEKGTGKGTLARLLQRIFGEHAFQVSSKDEVVGKFNGHLQNVVLFIADEAYWGGDKRCVGRLQAMITEPTLSIEQKGLDVIQVRNYLHVVMLAEPGWVVPAGRYERRYAAIDVSKSRRGDREYFRALHKQIEDGGAEAMFWELARMDLGDWHPRDIPDELLEGAALQKQRLHNLPPKEQWLLLLLQDAHLPRGEGIKPNRPNAALTKDLLADARSRVPRLQWMSDLELRNFLTDAASIGFACEKYRLFSKWLGLSAIVGVQGRVGRALWSGKLAIGCVRVGSGLSLVEGSGGFHGSVVLSFCKNHLPFHALHTLHSLHY